MKHEKPNHPTAGTQLGFVRAATALGVLSMGALATGAVAIGALAIRRLAVGTGRISRLSIDELEIGKLRVREHVTEPNSQQEAKEF